MTPLLLSKDALSFEFESKAEILNRRSNSVEIFCSWQKDPVFTIFNRPTSFKPTCLQQSTHPFCVLPFQVRNSTCSIVHHITVFKTLI
jgi:hypothetical protein